MLIAIEGGTQATSSGGLPRPRAVLEERFLREGLEGYAAYMQRVRYRLIPGVW
jgi:protein-S-isoprenylcysteine O-methyltransferase Ste14